jgi:putative ABC transport system permease protein
VAGLLLARASSRRTEIAIRSALGAGRWRIVRQLITESFPLSFLGGVLGLVLAWGGLKLFVVAAPPGFPRLEELRLDSAALLFTAVVVVLTGFIFGVVPALQASKQDVVNPLKEAGRSGSDGARSQLLRSILVTTQIALALVLLIGAGLMINSFLRIQKADLGADPTGLLTFDFRFPQSETIKPFGRYRGVGLWDVSPSTTATFTRVLERMQTIPGVTSVTASDRPPLTGQGIDMAFLINGRPAPPPSGASSGASQEQGQTASYFAVAPNFFSTLKIPILQGRDFTPRDDAAGTPVIIINQTLARRYFPNEDPVGKHITLDFVPDEKAREIIAVAGDTKLNRFQDQKFSVVYVPYGQQASRWLGPNWADRAGMYFVLRTAGDPLKLAPAMRSALAEVDPNKPAGEVRTLEGYLDRQVAYQRMYIFLLGIFGGIALILACIGIYGVMAYSVAERTREIGVRMALGAGPGEVLSLVVRKALMLISIGVIIGLGGSFALTRVIKSALVGVTATDPATFAGVSLLLACFALIACLVPTRRAVRVDPNIALRYE